MKLFGRPHSVYVRSVRLALEEKGLAYALEPIDPFAPEGVPDGYLEIHPFAKIPAFSDGAVHLFESDAILRYLEARYPDPPLSPADDPVALARMTQVMRIMDNYAYPSMVWSVFVPLYNDGPGRMPLDQGLAQSRRVLEVLDRLTRDRLTRGEGFLIGDTPSLADTHFLPAFVLFAAVDPGRRMIEEFPRLSGWLERMRARPSVERTRGPVG